MLLAEQLLVCAVEPGSPVMPRTLPAGVGGALAAELSLAGHIRLGVHNTVAVADATPPGDPLLDAVLEGLVEAHEQGTTEQASGWLIRIGRGAWGQVRERALDNGLVAVVPGGRSWMVVVRKPDGLELTSTGQMHRDRLVAVLRDQLQPDEHLAALAALASACGLIKGLVGPADARDAARRADGLGTTVPEATRRAIRTAERSHASLMSPG